MIQILWFRLGEQGEPLKTCYANRFRCRVLVRSSPIYLICLVAHFTTPCTQHARDGL